MISVFDPTPATSVVGFQLQSGAVGKHGDWVASAVVSHATDQLVHDAFASGTFLNNHGVITRSTLIELGGAYAFLDRFEAGARMPLYSQNGDALGDSRTRYTQSPVSGTAIGDLTLHGKVRLLDRALEGDGRFALAGGVQLTLPTATDGAFTGLDKPSGRALVLASLVPGAFGTRVTLSMNAGAAVRATARYANLEQKSAVAWGLGASVRVLDRLWVVGETFGDMVPSGRRDEMGGVVALSPIEWLGGVQWRPDHRLTVGLAAGRGLTSAIGTPALRGVLALTFSPGAPALKTLYRPPPPRIDGDADGDGIPDSVDKCPNEPEDLDMFDDADGCPDLDNDGDGIPDAQDKCPLDPEDKDGFQDDDGCPDLDNDGDGVPDAKDKCPNEPEDKDGFQDLDGCPDLDNDGDGIPDAQDKCPNAAETINGFQDDDGCPDSGDSLVVLSPDRLELLESIQFTRDHKIAKASHNLLAQIAATLRARGEIVRLRITSHVHPTASANRDLELSDRRGQAVRDWLIKWGIAANRLEVRGFGSTKALGTSAAVNNRVELIILERR